MANKVHKLKLWPEYFAAVADGTKPFEIRKNDRDFQVDDTLLLQEFLPERQAFTGRFVSKKIIYITDFAQQDGYVVMGIK
ncbi:MAG: ASCH/PUA domain-containing protein [Bacillus sp. (in: firmicutes)]